MLNLQTYKNKNLYPIKMFDGKVLKLQPPTHALLVKILDLKDSVDAGDELGTTEDLYRLLTDIMNTNIDGVEFSLEKIQKDFSYELAGMVIDDYLESTLKILGESKSQQQAARKSPNT